MTIKPFFPVFVVLVGVVIYAYNVPEKKPERGTTATPKQYIEMVEKSKAKRLEKSKQERTGQASEE